MTSWRSFIDKISSAPTAGSSNSRRRGMTTKIKETNINNKRQRTRRGFFVRNGGAAVVATFLVLFAAATVLFVSVVVVQQQETGGGGGSYYGRRQEAPIPPSDSAGAAINQPTNNNNNNPEDGLPLRTPTRREEDARGQCSCATPSSSSANSTDDNNTNNYCCDRKILRAHKMGVVLIRELFPNIESEIIGPSAAERASNYYNDYRHVVVTRPIYDSIVSGYHKSGRECWLDQHGRPRAVNKTFEWQSELALPLLPSLPQSSNNNNEQRVVRVGKDTTLCEYLSKAPTEQDGLRAYVDFSLSSLYKGLLPHREMVRKLERQQQQRHTLFVCFADLENKETKFKTYQKIMNWLYPGGKPGGASMPGGGGDGGREGKDSSSGGHGTSRDIALRQRLVSIIEEIDKEHFNGIGGEATKAFGCDNNRKRKTKQSS